MNRDDIELLLHLEYVPYLKIPKRVPTKKLLWEAKALEAQLTPYRPDNSEWTTVALRSPGGDSGAPNLTKKKEEALDSAFARLTPSTVKFLKSIVHWNKASRVRILMLKANGAIKTHRETDLMSYFFSVNISLNMPKKCTYMIDTNFDGTENKYTKSVPFSNSGSVFLLNNARYHKVSNASKKDRTHLQIIGPLKLDSAQLVKLARKQNKVKNIQDLVIKLIQKKNHLKEKILSDSALNKFRSILE